MHDEILLLRAQEKMRGVGCPIDANGSCPITINAMTTIFPNPII